MGNRDRAALGRSMGGVWLKPNASAAVIIGSGPIHSAPISAKAVLHDARRISMRFPPQLLPAKFEIGEPDGIGS